MGSLVAVNLVVDHLNKVALNSRLVVPSLKTPQEGFELVQNNQKALAIDRSNLPTDRLIILSIDTPSITALLSQLQGPQPSSLKKWPN